MPDPHEDPNSYILQTDGQKIVLLEKQTEILQALVVQGKALAAGLRTFTGVPNGSISFDAGRAVAPTWKQAANPDAVAWLVSLNKAMKFFEDQ